MSVSDSEQILPLSAALQYEQPGAARELECGVLIIPPAPQHLLQHIRLIRRSTDHPPYVKLPPRVASELPDQANANAIFDTGATHTCVSRRLLDEFGVPTGVTIAVDTVNGEDAEPHEYHEYAVGLLLSKTLCFPAIQVLDAETVGTDVLIGMDILGQIRFRYKYDSRQEKSVLKLVAPWQGDP